jgi:hypothetical protein
MIQSGSAQEDDRQAVRSAPDLSGKAGAKRHRRRHAPRPVAWSGVAGEVFGVLGTERQNGTLRRPRHDHATRVDGHSARETRAGGLAPERGPSATSSGWRSARASRVFVVGSAIRPVLRRDRSMGTVNLMHFCRPGHQPDNVGESEGCIDGMSLSTRPSRPRACALPAQWSISTLERVIRKELPDATASPENAWPTISSNRVTWSTTGSSRGLGSDDVSSLRVRRESHIVLRRDECWTLQERCKR